MMVRRFQPTAFLLDLDGTLVDSVYAHVLAWHEALNAEGKRFAIFAALAYLGERDYARIEDWAPKAVVPHLMPNHHCAHGAAVATRYSCAIFSFPNASVLRISGLAETNENLDGRACGVLQFAQTIWQDQHLQFW